MRKIFFATLLLVLSFTGAAFAQIKSPKVVKYIAPNYPAAALAATAEGEVVVSVKIDREGKVFSAISERGHPLLRKSAEWAAANWKFSGDDAVEAREVKIVFVYGIDFKNRSKEKIKFKKPYYLYIRKEHSQLNYSNFAT